MDLPKSGDATLRFLAFVEGLTRVIGHADRAKPLRDYCIGLMMPGERISTIRIAPSSGACRAWRNATTPRARRGVRCQGVRRRSGP